MKQGVVDFHLSKLFLKNPYESINFQASYGSQFSHIILCGPTEIRIYWFRQRLQNKYGIKNRL